MYLIIGEDCFELFFITSDVQAFFFELGFVLSTDRGVSLRQSALEAGRQVFSVTK